MKAAHELTHWRLPILCILVLIGWKVDATGFVGVDMAHHYALVQRLVEKWRLPPADDLFALTVDWQSLGEMIHYPALSHRLAAIVGQVLGSAFLGMQVVALIATAVIWAGIGAVLFTTPRTTASVAALVTAACLAATTLIFHLPVHGDEVVNAYFFAQLVGQAFAVACVVAWVGAQWRADIAVVRGLLMLAMPSVAAWFHLLPALQLLAFFGCAALVEGWTASPGHRRRTFFINGGLTAAGAVLLAVNPSVQAMLDIATNNGDLPLALPTGNGVFAVLATIVLGLVAINLTLWQRLALRGDGRAFAGFKALTLFAATVALLCLAQIGAVEMGIGNDYAVRKHIYSLMSGIAVQAGVLAGLIVALRRSDPGAAAEGARPHGLGVSVFMVAAFALTTPPHLREGAATVTARIVAYERQIKALRDTRVPAAQARHNMVVGLAGVPSAISYMFSIGLMGTPRGANAEAILYGHAFAVPDTVGSIITSVAADPYDVEVCRTFVSATGLTMVDGTCHADNQRQQRTCEGAFDFRLGQSVRNFGHLLSGFSSPEPAGRWTDGDAASFRCLQPEGLRAAVRVTLETSAFLHPTQGPTHQRAIVKVNGRPVAEHLFTGAAGEKIFDLPLSVADGPEIEIVIETPDAAVPAERGLGDDPRRLGVQVRRIQFSPAPAGQ